MGCQEPGLTGLVAEKKEGRGAGRNCVNRGSRLGARGEGGPREEREDHGEEREDHGEEREDPRGERAGSGRVEFDRLRRLPLSSGAGTDLHGERKGRDGQEAEPCTCG